MKSMCVAFLSLFVSSLLMIQAHAGVTAREAKLLNDEALRYFSFPTLKDAHTIYQRGTKNERTYHFTNLRWKTSKSRLTESDRRNGITRKIFAKLYCDSSFRIKQNGKWQPWREGGWSIPSTTFCGYLISDTSGKTYYKRSMSSQTKFYTKPRGRGLIIPLKRN